MHREGGPASVFFLTTSTAVQTLSRGRLCEPVDCRPPDSLCPWDFPGKSTRVGCHVLLQGIFLTQGSNLGLLRLLLGRWILYHWATWEAPSLQQNLLFQTATSQLPEVSSPNYPAVVGKLLTSYHRHFPWQLLSSYFCLEVYIWQCKSHLEIMKGSVWDWRPTQWERCNERWKRLDPWWHSELPTPLLNSRNKQILVHVSHLLQKVLLSDITGLWGRQFWQRKMMTHKICHVYPIILYSSQVNLFLQLSSFINSVSLHSINLVPNCGLWTLGTYLCPFLELTSLDLTSTAYLICVNGQLSTELLSLIPYRQAYPFFAQISMDHLNLV